MEDGRRLPAAGDLAAILKQGLKETVADLYIVITLKFLWSIF